MVILHSKHQAAPVGQSAEKCFEAPLSVCKLALSALIEISAANLYLLWAVVQITYLFRALRTSAINSCRSCGSKMRKEESSTADNDRVEFRSVSYSLSGFPLHFPSLIFFLAPFLTYIHP